MPRIQILPLPEGVSDERPPFALVIDQVDSEALLRDLGDHDALVERTGARAVLVFEDTIEIPVNDVSAYATPTMVVRVEGDADSGSADLADQIRRRIEDAQAAYGRTA
ncbi:hypothetical protein EF913_28285 [Streptomyces sp. WAC04189]|uniref:hypothetical protein n=1 Tax=Streptomyces sp. WAC04189 TaxID=2487411 RepID=UPI000FB30818|nr:hypothetical protein [Streptomyces sp. WAC04189]RSR98031.1 hypothetical protein EF913_28285 [Streptomyces sp. WAC04189]